MNRDALLQITKPGGPLGTLATHAAKEAGPKGSKSAGTRVALTLLPHNPS